MLTTITRTSRLTAVAAISFALLLLATVPAAQAASPKHLSKKEIAHLIATAKSPADHIQLANYYKAEADRLEAEAKEHDEFAAAYRKSPISQAAAMKNPMAPNTVAHCEYFAKTLREAAKSARELAASHEQMAKDAGANPR
jgi:hypothetical protein